MVLVRWRAEKRVIELFIKSFRKTRATLDLAADARSILKIFDARFRGWLYITKWIVFLRGIFWRDRFYNSQGHYFEYCLNTVFVLTLRESSIVRLHVNLPYGFVHKRKRKFRICHKMKEIIILLLSCALADFSPDCPLVWLLKERIAFLFSDYELNGPCIDFCLENRTGCKVKCSRRLYSIRRAALHYRASSGFDQS